MKAIKAILLILAVAAISCESIDKSFILEKFMDSPKELFKAYYTLFSKEDSYDINSPEGIKRFDIFKTNVDWIKAENAKAGKKVYGITQFADLTHAEFKLKYLMKTEKLEAAFNVNFSNIKEITSMKKNFIGGFPTVDWRSVMNPVKDQGQCGSCWAFGAMATVEGNYNISSGILNNFAEQYLVNCDDKDGGCNGGWPTNTGVWLSSNGVVQTSDLPYAASKTLCAADLKRKALNIVQGFEQCSNCTADEWTAILAKGPIEVAMDASSQNFGSYKPSSIDVPWVPSSCQQVNHAVTVVGVNVVNGVTLLIVRNSWGNTWGFEGHFSIDASNPCIIMNYAWRAVTQENKPFPAPVCPTFVSDCTTTAKTITECGGIADSNDTTKLGTPIRGWTQTENSKYWNFYQGKNCSGNKDWKYQNEACFAKFWSKYKLTEYNSAANNVDSASIGCVIIYTGPCATGQRYEICSNISDLSASGITSIGTVIFNRIKQYPGNAVALAFFDQKGFAGNGVSIPQAQYYNLSNYGYFTDFIPKALSLAIVTYS